MRVLVGLGAVLACASMSVTARSQSISSGPIERVSKSTGGDQGNAASYSGIGSVSNDGRYVAFGSDASNLVPSDTNGHTDIFVRDRQTLTTTRLPIAGAGQGNSSSYDPTVSREGRYVAFYSTASNLVSGDTNGSGDVFVHDRQSGATVRASVSSSGAQGNGGSYEPAISGNGRYLTFWSTASNLVTGDTNGTYDIFVRDLQLGTTARVSVASSGAQSNGYSWDSTISADGRLVLFGSGASNLVQGDTNGVGDVFVHDRATSRTTRVSVSSAGLQGNGLSNEPMISDFGRYLVYYSTASNLVPGDTNGVADVFVHDLQTSVTTRASVSTEGAQGDQGSGADPEIFISEDGRFVAFGSYATTLLGPGKDTNGYFDVFLRDRLAGTTSRISETSPANPGNAFSDGAAHVTPDGRFVVFGSNATNLLGDEVDSNGSWDVFVRDRTAASTGGFVLAVRPGICPGKAFAVGTITLQSTSFAPTVFNLSSSNTTAATVPASVTVPAMTTQVTFLVTTKQVALTTALKITATSLGTAEAALTVVPNQAGLQTAMLLKDGNRTVKGIVCDNFKTTPLGERDRVAVIPDPQLGSITTIYGYVCNVLGEPVSDGTAGYVESTGPSLLFFPPLEYNPNQNPTQVSQLANSPVRTVHVRAVFQTSNGAWYTTNPAPVVLARTPIVFIHGINNDYTNWGEFATHLRNKSLDGFPYAMVSHPTFNGRGPLEKAVVSAASKIQTVLSAIQTGNPWRPGLIDGVYPWDAFYTRYSQVGPLAAKRVDLVAHSYGGMVARWLVADREPLPVPLEKDSWQWYLRRGLFEPGATPGLFAGQVRKVITLGSMWRGTPVANVVNEVNATSDFQSGVPFGEAPMMFLFGFVEISLQSFVNSVPVLGDERYPAFQVMGVESPWLRYLNSGRYPSGATHPTLSNFPMRGQIGYASAAGDDSDYVDVSGFGVKFLYGLNLFGIYDELQQPSWFPYVGLEEAASLQKNYSDGIVPVWSACIPGSYRIYGYDHAELIKKPEPIDQTLVWLNSASLPSGADLNAKWNAPASWPVARGDNYRWNFNDPAKMAPYPQNLVYAMRTATDNDGATRYLGRFALDAVRERDLIAVTDSTPWSIKVGFHAGVEVNAYECFVFTANGPPVQVAHVPFTYMSKLPAGSNNLTVNFGSSLLTRGQQYYASFRWYSKGVHGKTSISAGTDRTPNFQVP